VREEHRDVNDADDDQRFERAHGSLPSTMGPPDPCSIFPLPGENGAATAKTMGKNLVAIA
jgi:hypothetical protein